MAGHQNEKIAQLPYPTAAALESSAPESLDEPEPLPFCQHLLGITFLAENWEDDLPLELFESEDSFQP